MNGQEEADIRLIEEYTPADLDHLPTVAHEPTQQLMAQLPSQPLPTEPHFSIASLPMSTVDVHQDQQNAGHQDFFIGADIPGMLSSSVPATIILKEELEDKGADLDGDLNPPEIGKNTSGACIQPKLLEKEVPGSTWKYKRLEVYHEKEIASVARQVFPEANTNEEALELWQTKLLAHEQTQGSKSTPAVMRLLHEPETQWQISLSLGIKNHGRNSSGEQQPSTTKRSYVLKICRLSDFMTKVHLQQGDRFCLYPGAGKVAYQKDEQQVEYLPEFYVEVQRGPPSGVQADSSKEKKKRKRPKKEDSVQTSTYNPVVGSNQVVGANALPIIFSSVRRDGCFVDCFISSIPKFELGNISVIVPQDGKSIKIRAQWSGQTQLVDQQMMSVTLGDLQMPVRGMETPWSQGHQHEIKLDQFLQQNEMVTTNLQHQLDENTSWLVIRVPTITTDQIMLINHQNQNHLPLQQQLPM